MLKGRNIICISGTEWGGDYIKATVELMKEICVSNQLLFVNSSYTFKDIYDGWKGIKPVDFQRALGLKPRVDTQTLPNGGIVHILTPPPFLSINFFPQGFLYDTMLGINAWLIRITAKRALKKLGMRKDLIHFVGFNPGMGVMNGRRYAEKVLIYHCYDEMRGTHPWSQKHGVGMEERFFKMADGVIVTSNGLYEAKKDKSKLCYIVKNAVNIDLFSKAFTPEVKQQKVVGYIGTIDERLDFELLTYLLENMPEVQFVFVGRSNTDHAEEDVLKKYPNAVLTGPKTPEELPGYLETFSAGIIPFVKSDFTKGIYPMKINEYLAAGLPVISTDFSNLDDFLNIIQITGNKEAYLTYLRNELATDTPDKKRARLEVAKQNTWQVRAEELSEAILKIEATLA